LLGGGRGGRGSRGATAVGGLAGGDGAPPRSGGALGPCRGPLREGDAQLLAGTVPLLGGGGPAADQQRPGAVVRQLSLPREASQWSQGSVTQPGVTRSGTAVGRGGDAAAPVQRGGVSRGRSGPAGGVASAVASPPASACQSPPLPPGSAGLPAAIGGATAPVNFAALEKKSRRASPLGRA